MSKLTGVLISENHLSSEDDVAHSIWERTYQFLKARAATVLLRHSFSARASLFSVSIACDEPEARPRGAVTREQESKTMSLVRRSLVPVTKHMVEHWRRRTAEETLICVTHATGGSR